MMWCNLVNSEMCFALFIFCLNVILASSCGIESYSKFRQSKQQRIVGGTATFGWKYPWFAMLVDRGHGDPCCGASLVTKRHLLSAAHCYDDYLEAGQSDFHNLYDVHLGVHNLCTPSVRHRIFQVKTVHIHPEYDTQASLSADVVIIELHENAVGFEPICLPPFSKDHPSQAVGKVIGFGVTQFQSNSLVCVMREIQVQLHSADDCARSGNNVLFNKPDTFCAGFKAGAIDACQGDSGGPLQLVDDHNVNYVVGVVSFGEKCALRNRPGIYTSVAYHMKWITECIYD